MKRIEAGDPAAMTRKGAERFEQGDYDGSVQYLTMAAELGDVKAHFNLGVAYNWGYGVEKDEERRFIIWRGLPLEVIPRLDSILDTSRKGMVGWKEQ